MRHADALGALSAFVIQERHGQPVGHDIEHRDRDRSPFPGDASADQRFKNGRIGGCACRDIDQRYAHPRRFRRPAGDGAEPRLGLDQQVIGLAVGHRPVIAITGNRAGDELGKVPRQPLDRKA